MPSSDLGFTPLITACTAGDVAAARSLIEGGADVNARAHDGWSPVFAAALAGSAEILELLVARGASIDDVYAKVAARDTEDAWGACSFAAAGGHRDALEVLLQHGAPMSARDAAHFLWHALRRQGYELRLICRYDPGEEHGEVGYKGRHGELWWTGAPITLPPEDVALVRPHVEVRTERAYWGPLTGAFDEEPRVRVAHHEFHATTETETTEAPFLGLDDVLLSPALVGHVEGAETLPVARRSILLQRAILRRRPEIVRVLLRDTPPGFADDAVAVPDIFELLLAAGLTPSAAIMTSAIRSGQLASVKLLVDRGFSGAKLTEMDAIACAAGECNVDMLQLLLRHGARFGGHDALALAARVGGDRSLATVELLLDHGAPANRTTARRGPLFEAVRSADARVVFRLLEAGADPNERDEDGNTPLHAAARVDRGLSVVKTLLRAGSDPHARNAKKSEPYYYALLGHHRGLMEVLQSPPAVDRIPLRPPRLRLSPAEIRALGCRWPPVGWVEEAYGMADGRVDLERALAAAAHDAAHHTSQATAGRWFASQASRVSFDDYEDFRDQARDDEGRARAAKTTHADLQAIIACVRSKLADGIAPRAPATHAATSMPDVTRDRISEPRKLTAGMVYLVAYLPWHAIAHAARTELLDHLSASADAKLAHAIDLSRMKIETSKRDAAALRISAMAGLASIELPATSEWRAIADAFGPYLESPLLQSAWRAGEAARLVAISAALLAQVSYLRCSAPEHPELRAFAEDRARALVENAALFQQRLEATGLRLVTSHAGYVARTVHFTREAHLATTSSGSGRLSDLVRDLDEAMELDARRFDETPPPEATEPPTVEEQALYARILQAPSDMNLRHELMRLGEKRNDPRAKVVRLLISGDDRSRHQAYEITRAHPEWRRALEELGARDIEFELGFPDMITVDAELLLTRGTELLAAAPITRLKVRNAEGRVADVVRSPLLRTIERLDLDSQRVTDADLVILAASPYAQNLDRLDLRYNPIGARGIEAIAASPNLKKLRVVALDGNPDDPCDRQEYYNDTDYDFVPTEAGKALEAKYGKLKWLRRV